MIIFLKGIKDFFIEALMPKECLFCLAKGSYVCQECLKKIKPALSEDCKIKLRPSFLDGLLVSMDWRQPEVQKIIHIYKYNFVKDLATEINPIMANKLNKFMQTQDLQEWVLVPVPLHKRKLNYRGFNQAEEMAKLLGKSLNLQAVQALKRVKAKKPQMKLSREERLKNVKDVYAVAENTQVENKKIILVDDVATTGATLNELARILKNRGALKVYGFCLARG